MDYTLLMTRPLIGAVERDCLQSGPPVPRSPECGERGTGELCSGKASRRTRSGENDPRCIVAPPAPRTECVATMSHGRGIEGARERQRVSCRGTKCTATSASSERATHGFAVWVGAGCARCGLPALLHDTERCDEEGV